MRQLGAIAVATAMLGLGGVSMAGGYTPGYRRRRDPHYSLDDIEEMWVHARLRLLHNKRRQAAAVIAELAMATGPWAHRFGYGPHPGTREQQRRLRQEARRAEKRAARAG